MPMNWELIGKFCSYKKYMIVRAPCFLLASPRTVEYWTRRQQFHVLSCHPSGLYQSWVVLHCFTDRRTHSQWNHRAYSGGTPECWQAKEHETWPWAIRAPEKESWHQDKAGGVVILLPSSLPHAAPAFSPKVLTVIQQVFWSTYSVALRHCTKYWG